MLINVIIFKEFKIQESKFKIQASTDQNLIYSCQNKVVAAPDAIQAAQYLDLKDQYQCI